jgi:hypothetical protein
MRLAELRFGPPGNPKALTGPWEVKTPYTVNWLAKLASVSTQDAESITGYCVTENGAETWVTTDPDPFDPNAFYFPYSWLAAQFHLVMKRLERPESHYRKHNGNPWLEE